MPYDIFRCAKSGKIMLNPVTATDGEMYEMEEIQRWFLDHNTSPKTGEPLPTNPDGTPKKTILFSGHLQRYIQSTLAAHPELWQTEEIYVSENLQRDLINAVSDKNHSEVARIVDSDKRLLTRPLVGNQHLLSLSLASSPEVVQTVITALSDKFWELPEIGTDEGVGFFRTAATHLGTAGARLIATQLEWQAADIQKQFEAALSANDLKVTAVTLDLGAQLTADQLQAVIAQDYHELVRLLVSRHPDLSLQHAIRQNQPALLTLALNARPNLEAINSDGYLPLHLAFKLGHLELIPALIAAGADLNKKDADGNSALLLAVKAKRLDLVKLMLERPSQPAEVNVTNNQGDSTLHLAARIDDLAFVQPLITYLFSKSANGLSRNRAGQKPEEVAMAANLPQIATIIDKTRHDHDVGQQVEKVRQEMFAQQQAQMEQMIAMMRAAGISVPPMFTASVNQPQFISPPVVSQPTMSQDSGSSSSSASFFTNNAVTCDVTKSDDPLYGAVTSDISRP